MTRLTIAVPEEVAAGLKDEARRRHLSVSELVRERIGQDPTVDPKTGKRTVPFAGIASKKLRWSGATVDEELARTYADDIRRRSFSERGRMII